MTELLYGLTQHPDVWTGREKIRHLIVEGDSSRTLCGRRVVWLYDYATPLAPDCKQCAKQAETRDAALRRR